MREVRLKLHLLDGSVWLTVQEAVDYDDATHYVRDWIRSCRWVPARPMAGEATNDARVYAPMIVAIEDGSTEA